MRNKIIFALVIVGALGAALSAYLYARPPTPQPPAFKPATNPYSQGIFANGIIESYQLHGENINIYPEVAGTVREILVAEGQSVPRGTPLLRIDETVQRATVEQQEAQADAAQAMLQELKAQPRKETLEIAVAQVDLAKANLKTAQDTLDKQEASYKIDPRSVSKDQLDTDVNAVKVASANLDVQARQFELTRAGAWIYDIRNQEQQYTALSRAAASSKALLAKYTVTAPSDGVVLSIQSALGAYVSPQGAYDTYTQGFDPVIVMGNAEKEEYLSVRCYVDEILVPKLPPLAQLKATMFIRGSETQVPMEFVRVQPYVSPKIELSNDRLERVDLRVLPVIFRFRPPAGAHVYPGQMVDVYIGGGTPSPPALGKRP